MIPYDVDPSLHTGEPVPAQLDDGFSPPPAREPQAAVAVVAGTQDSLDAAQPTRAN